MTVAGEVGSGLVTAMELSEGNVTVTTTSIEKFGSATTTTLSWASEVSKDDAVKSTGVLLVQIATAGDQTLLGNCSTVPSWQGAGEIPWTASGATTDYRTADIEMYGSFIRSITAGAGATTVAVTNSIKPHATVLNSWDKDATANGTYALQEIVAAASGLVLFNFYGAF